MYLCSDGFSSVPQNQRLVAEMLPGEGMGSAADDRSQSGNETDMDATIVNYLGEASADEPSADTVSLPS